MGQRRSIAGSRILITGASQGIGRALAELLAQRGAHVLAAARSDDAARRAGREGPRRPAASSKRCAPT